MSYTITELNDAIADEESDWEGSWDELKWSLETSARHGGGTGVEIPGIGRAVLADKLDGRESAVWFIIGITDADGEERFFRRQGYYDSYGGEDSFDGPTTEVSASQQLITVYNPI